MSIEFFIPGNVPSLKNSRVGTSHGNFPSKTVQKYLRSLGIKKCSAKNGVEHYARRPATLQCILKVTFFGWHPKYPVKVGFHFIRGTRHKFDYINAKQIIQDLLVAYRVLQDDDADHLIPYVWEIEGENYNYDKKNPGVWIKID